MRPSPAPAGTQAVRRVLGAALLASAWVQRLGRISFLGTLDAHPQSKVRSSRLDHSLSVARLGLEVGAEERTQLRIRVEEPGVEGGAEDVPALSEHGETRAQALDQGEVDRDRGAAGVSGDEVVGMS